MKKPWQLECNDSSANWDLCWHIFLILVVFLCFPQIAQAIGVLASNIRRGACVRFGAWVLPLPDVWPCALRSLASCRVLVPDVWLCALWSLGAGFAARCHCQMCGRVQGAAVVVLRTSKSFAIWGLCWCYFLCFGESDLTTKQANKADLCPNVGACDIVLIFFRSNLCFLPFAPTTFCRFVIP